LVGKSCAGVGVALLSDRAACAAAELEGVDRNSVAAMVDRALVSFRSVDEAGFAAIRLRDAGVVAGPKCGTPAAVTVPPPRQAPGSGA